MPDMAKRMTNSNTIAQTQTVRRGAMGPSRASLRLLPLLLLLAVCLVLTACGRGETNVSTGNRLGILHMGNTDEPQELDPHVVTGIPEGRIIRALLEGLVGKDPATLEPIPAVARSWEISDDGTHYTFHLDPQARWSNGDPHTAHDYVWTWRRALHPGLGNYYAYMLYPIRGAAGYHRGELKDFDAVGVRALDDHTLSVQLENPTPYFLQLLDHFALYPLHPPTLERFGASEQRGTRWTRAGNFVGNGPFRLTRWQLNRIIEVDKNPHYREADKVRLNGIHFHPIQNITTEERMFRAGQLHLTSNVPMDKIPVYRERSPEMLRVHPYLGTYFYRINTTAPHLADRRVRMALALAVDREQLVRHVTGGGEHAAYTITPPGTQGYTAQSPQGFDPQRARALLAEAGYPDGAGFPVTELVYNTSESHRKLAVAVQQMWKQHLNIDVRLYNQDWKVFLSSVSALDYELARAVWIGDYVDPNSFLDMWLTGSGNNRTGWSNPDFDRLVAVEAPRATSREERYALLREAEWILLEDAPIIPVYIYNSVRLVHPSVHGLTPNLLNHIPYQRLWLDAGTSQAPRP